LRSGLCNGFIQPFWMAQDMLISAANAQCDLRLLYPAISTASGGYVTAQEWARAAVGKQLNLTAAEMVDSGLSGARCTSVVSQSLAVLMQDTTERLLGEMRADQRSRMRDAPCNVDGTPPMGARAAEIEEGTAQLSVAHFFGLFIVMFVIMGSAIVLSEPFRQSVRNLSSWARDTLRYVFGDVAATEIVLKKAKTVQDLAVMGKHTAQTVLSMVGATPDVQEARAVLESLTKPPPTTQEWRESVDGRLGRLEATVERSLRQIVHQLEQLSAAPMHTGIAQSPRPSAAESSRRSAQSEVSHQVHSVVSFDLQPSACVLRAPNHKSLTEESASPLAVRVRVDADHGAETPPAVNTLPTSAHGTVYEAQYADPGRLSGHAPSTRREADTKKEVVHRL